jgi:hypothetical protein
MVSRLFLSSLLYHPRHGITDEPRYLYKVFGGSNEMIINTSSSYHIISQDSRKEKQTKKELFLI